MLLKIQKLFLYLILSNLFVSISWASNLISSLIQNPSSQLVELRNHIPIPELIDESDIEKYSLKHNSLLNYMDRLDELLNQYENISFIGSGYSSFVYKAYLKEDRLEVGLKKGNAIALRVTEISTENKLSSHIQNFYNSIIPQINLLELGTDFGKKITDYYPKIYGYFLGPPMPRSLVFDTQNETGPFDNQKIVYGWVEMELVDHDFTKEFSNNEPFPPSIDFENQLGKWAGYAISKISICDYSNKNLGILSVPYYRAYYLRNKIYLFPPGKMPKRLDIDFSNTQNFVGIEMIDDESDEYYFNYIFSRVNQFEVKDNSIFSQIPDDQIRHYKIPEKYLMSFKMY